MLFDAHTHVTPETGFLSDDFCQLAVGSTPEECRDLASLCLQSPDFFYACGVHPWKSGEIPVEALLPFVSRSVAIGEIGMDRVWCQVDLQVQREVFRQQLRLAEDVQKPIVLHTKGCEAEVLEEIAAFPLPILVHWYSCDDYLEGYLAKGCSFTVGPDVKENPSVSALVSTVPLDHLMVESDGLHGASWALGREVSPSDIPDILMQTIGEIARIKEIPIETVQQAVFANAIQFITRPKLFV